LPTLKASCDHSECISFLTRPGGNPKNKINLDSKIGFNTAEENTLTFKFCLKKRAIWMAI
jgi:hypothetical protein